MNGNRTGWGFSLLPFALTVYFLKMLPRIANGEVIRKSWQWAPGLETSFSFYLDGLSLLFALIVTGVGVFVFVYSGDYLSAHDHKGRFFAFLSLFMVSMLGLVLADDLITMFMFWELTTLSSFLLIGFEHASEKSRKGAMQALLVTGFGGLALLAGMLLLMQAGDQTRISMLLDKGGVIKAHEHYRPILFLVLIAAFTKSAQTPFHFWLPSAMAAPTPVSAYLHSATMVKAGIYILARFHPILGGTPLWTALLVGFGTATVLTGAYYSLLGTDLKQILAYATVGALGLFTMMIGIGGKTAIEAMIVYLLAHASYKGSLFMVSGILDHNAGSRNPKHLGGLFRAMPITGFAAGLAVLSMAGLPPTMTFIGKERAFGAALDTSMPVVLTGAMLLVSISFVAAGGIVGIKPFFGPRRTPSGDPTDGSVGFWFGPLSLAVLGIVLGGLNSQAGDWVIAPAVSAVLRTHSDVHLSFWHGFNTQLLLSATAVIAGVAVVLLWGNRFRALFSFVVPLGRFGAEWCYRLLLETSETLARAITRFAQNGHLHLYILTVVITTIGLICAALWKRGVLIDLSMRMDIRFYEAVIAGIMLLAAGLVIAARSRMTAVVALGVVGYGMALQFLFFSAPDLAITQFAIETLSVILLVLVILHLPERRKVARVSSRLRDGIAALAVGVTMTILILAVHSLPEKEAIGAYFSENSYRLAHGRNVVNVILTDFRGLDTLGEITVIALAAIGVFSLLRLTMNK